MLRLLARIGAAPLMRRGAGIFFQFRFALLEQLVKGPRHFRTRGGDGMEFRRCGWVRLVSTRTLTSSLYSVLEHLGRREHLKVLFQNFGVYTMTETTHMSFYFTRLTIQNVVQTTSWHVSVRSPDQPYPVLLHSDKKEGGKDDKHDL